MTDVKDWTLRGSGSVWLSIANAHSLTSTGMADTKLLFGKGWFQADLDEGLIKVIPHGMDTAVAAPIDSFKDVREFARWGRMILAIGDTDHD